MSNDDENHITIKLLGIERNLHHLTIAIKGDPDLQTDGIVQHIVNLRREFVTLRGDVKGLKDDRRTVKGWIAGLSAAGGLGGFLGHLFSKN